MQFENKTFEELEIILREFTAEADALKAKRKAAQSAFEKKAAERSAQAKIDAMGRDELDALVKLGSIKLTSEPNAAG